MSPATNSASTKPTNIGATDDWSRPIKLESPPKRVVVIGPGATEIVYALGRGNFLVGRDSASNFPAAANKLPIIGDFRGPFLESVRAARPDFIIVQGETYDAARLDTWQQKCGAPVAGLAAPNLKAVQRDIEKIGAWLGVDAAKVRSVLEVPPAPLKSYGTVFVEVSRRPLMTAGSDTLIGDVVSRAGLRNVAGIKGYKTFGLETLATLNPKFYLVAGNPRDRAGVIASLQQAPGLKELECVKAGRILVVDGDLLLRPGPRVGQGIRQLAESVEKLETAKTK